MTTPDPDQLADAIAAVRQVAASIDRVSERLETVKEESEERDKDLARRNRRTFRIAIGLIGGYAFDVVITTAVTILAVVALHASSTANQTRLSSLESCRASNVTRAENVTLWVHLAAATATSRQTPAQRKAVAGLIAYVRHIFAPRNCLALYGPHARPKPQTGGSGHGR